MKKINKICLDDAQDARYQIGFAKQNVQFGSLLLLMVMVFEAVLIIIMAFGKIKEMPDPGVRYIICYSYLLVLSGIGLLVLQKLKSNEAKKYKLINNLTTIYAFLIVVWAIAITILDNYGKPKGDNITVNVTILFVLAVALYIPLPYYCGLVLFDFGSLILASVLMNNYHFSAILNLSVLAFVCILIVFVLHNNKRNEIINNDIIEEQNQKLQVLNSELVKMSITDGLTGLYNRLYLDNKLKEEWKRTLTEQLPFTIAILDIDDFKTVNDVCGHLMGDTCLVNISDILKQVANEQTGYAFRFGGEEFLILLPNILDTEAFDIMEETRKKVNELKIIGHEDLDLRISIGIYSAIPNDMINAYNIISYADKALYEAKTSGKNRTIVYKENK